MKKYTNFEKNAIKNAAKSSYALVDKENKLKTALEEKHRKMEERFAKETAKLNDELAKNRELLDQFEAPILGLTGGKHSWELVERTVETVTDKDGNEGKRTKFTFVGDSEEESQDQENPEAQQVEEADDAAPAAEPSEEPLPEESPAEGDDDPFDKN